MKDVVFWYIYIYIYIPEDHILQRPSYFNPIEYAAISDTSHAAEGEHTSSYHSSMPSVGEDH
jgi:hypothetical protein